MTTMWRPTVLLAAWLFLGTSSIRGQTAAEGSRACWVPAVDPTCSSHWVGEVRGVLPLYASDLSRYLEPDGTTGEESSFEPGLEWEFGHLFSVAERWSIGPTVVFGTGAHPGFLRGVRARARYWGQRGPRLELEGGYARSDRNDTQSDPAANGVMLGVRTFVHPLIGIGAQLEWLEGDRTYRSDQPDVVVNDDVVGIGLHVSASGKPGIIASGVIGITAVIIAVVVGTGAS